MGESKRIVPIVTASFDDGHPLDLKVAEKLAARGLKATFYVALNHPKGPEISTEDLRRLRGLGMEIGSHTFTHRMLTGRPRGEVVDELTRSRKALEDLLGEPVTSLSYPEGLFTPMIRSTVAECGYRLARTTIAFRTGARFDPTRMPVTIEMIPLSRWGHTRHAGRDRNLKGIWNWWRLARADTDHLSCVKEKRVYGNCNQSPSIVSQQRRQHVEFSAGWSCRNRDRQLIDRLCPADRRGG